MIIRVQCECGKETSAKTGAAGGAVTCDACGRPLRVPAEPVRDHRPGWLQCLGIGSNEPVAKYVAALLAGAAVGVLIVVAFHFTLPGGRRSIFAREYIGPSSGLDSDGTWTPSAAPAVQPPMRQVTAAATAPAVHESDATPAAEPRHAAVVRTVMRDNTGVRVVKDKRTGATQLTVDPFPEEGPAKRAQAKSSRK